jgi:hypothetical protein
MGRIEESLGLTITTGRDSATAARIEIGQPYFSALSIRVRFDCAELCIHRRFSSRTLCEACVSRSARSRRSLSWFMRSKDLRM